MLEYLQAGRDYEEEEVSGYCMTVRYVKSKDEELDRILRRTRFARGCGPV